MELIEAVIARTEAVNGGINALTETLFEEAVPAARQAAARYARGRDLAPLLGLPVAAKGRRGLRGRTLSQGLVAPQGGARARGPSRHRPNPACRRHHPCPHHHARIQLRNRHPQSPVGRSRAIPGTGSIPRAAPPAVPGRHWPPAGAARHRLRHRRVNPFAGVVHGTVGYKAPYGRIPGLAPLSADHYRGDGPMARTVADAALLANVMAGRHPGDHSSLAGSPALSCPPGADASSAMAGMRIALCIRLGNYPVAADVEAEYARRGRGPA